MTHEHEKALVEEFLTALREGADFRGGKVRRLRAAIRARAYENQLKLEIASDRLAADLMCCDLPGARPLGPPPLPDADTTGAARPLPAE